MGMDKMGSALKFMIYFLILIGILIGISNMNFVTRRFGGNITINLEANHKLVNVTWKDSSLWILTKEMKEDDVAEVYHFKEDSNFGIFEGSVEIIESK